MNFQFRLSFVSLQLRFFWQALLLSSPLFLSLLVPLFAFRVLCLGFFTITAATAVVAAAIEG